MVQNTQNFTYSVHIRISGMGSSTGMSYLQKLGCVSETCFSVRCRYRSLCLKLQKIDKGYGTRYLSCKVWHHTMRVSDPSNINYGELRHRTEKPIITQFLCGIWFHWVLHNLCCNQWFLKTDLDSRLVRDAFLLYINASITLWLRTLRWYVVRIWNDVRHQYAKLKWL